MGFLRPFFTNLVCAFIHNKDRRRKTRVIMNSSMVANLRFIRRDIGGPVRKIKTFIGYQARSLLISVNDEWIYKFPLRRDNYRELALREKRIVDALTPYSPIYIPPVELIEYRGRLIRKYKFINGKIMRGFAPDEIRAHMPQLTRSAARFLYDVARADPEQIRDLKPTPDAMPGYMHGWCQGDLGDNFMIDPKTFEIIAIIDWEDASFMDFLWMLDLPRKNPLHQEFMQAVIVEYNKLYEQKK